MRAEEFRNALRALPLASPTTIIAKGPFVVLSPHPDDESLGLGGTIAAARAAGVDVRVIVISDGAKSHPNSRRFPHDRLVALRRAETEAAARHLSLAAGAVSHLDLPDTRVPVAGAAFEAALTRIADIVEDSRARMVFTAWGRDPHCDHEATAVMACALRARRPEIGLWSYPIWGWHLPADAEVDEPAPQGHRIDIAPWLPAKTAAVAAHASQMTDLIDDDPDGFCFTPDTLAPFLQPIETVFEVPR